MKFEEGTMLQWNKATTKPDADTTVLIFSQRACEPVQTGYWDGEVWRDVIGVPYRTHVEMWADLPYPIEKSEGRQGNQRHGNDSAAPHSTASLEGAAK